MRYEEFQQLPEAAEWYLKAPRDDPRNIRDIAAILGSLGSRDLADSWYFKLGDDDILGPPARSSKLALQGDVEQAVDALQTAYDGSFSRLYDGEGALPIPLEALSGLARFDELLQRFDADIASMREKTATLLPPQ